MSKHIKLNETLSGGADLSELTGTNVPELDKTGADVVIIGGTTISAKAKFVEAIYTNSDMTVTYNYYESASKVILYSTITTIYTSAQDTTFTSAAWS
jgi:hypothetical protein